MKLPKLNLACNCGVAINGGLRNFSCGTVAWLPVVPATKGVNSDRWNRYGQA